jgi:hypothetical protein
VSTLITGIVVGVPILFTDKNFVLDFTSIATLFAFVLVCGGVLLLPRREKVAGRFHLPFINSKFIFPISLTLVIVMVQISFPDYFSNLFSLADVDNSQASITTWERIKVLTPSVSLIIFWLIMILLAVLAFIKQFSLIPLMGLITCIYLLTGMTAANWIWFLAWLVLGLIVYFAYGFRNSKLSSKQNLK